MRKLGHPSAAILYTVIAGVFHLAGWRLPAPGPPMAGLPNAPVSRVPELKLRRTATGWPWAGIDGELLRRSIQRDVAVIWLRRLGNSLRLAFGQTPEWYFRGRTANTPETLFLTNELPLAAGLDVSNQEIVKRAVETIAFLNRRLAEEGWKVVVVPVPSKLSLYRERIVWPLLEKDPFTRQPLDQDRSDEVCDALFAGLSAAGVSAVDLRTPFRQRALADETGNQLYPAGESHWSAAAVALAAQFTADALGAQGLAQDPAPASAAPTAYLLSCDMPERSEAIEGFPAWLSQLRWYHETVTRGVKPGPLRREDRTALVAVSGTSYTGHYSWLGDAGLVAELDRRLPVALVRSYAEAGRGSLETARSFLAQKGALVAETIGGSVNHAISPDRKYWVWEFPLRDMAGFLQPIEWRPSLPPSGRSSAQQAEQIVFAEGFHQEERQTGATFRWVRRKATLEIRAERSAIHRLRLRTITPFLPGELQIAITADGRFIGAATARGTDFTHPVITTLDVFLRAGSNLITLEGTHDEVVFGPSDSRSVGFGLVLPVEVLP